jgi:hypothetical protein
VPTSNYVLALLGKTGGELELTLANLTWLYRLARTAALLGMALVLLGLLYHPDDEYLKPPKNALVPTINAILLQKAHADLLKKWGLSAYSVLYVLKGVLTPYFKAAYQPDGIAPFVDNLAKVSDGVRLHAESFLSGQIDATESQLIFNKLVHANFLTPLGVLLNDDKDYKVAAEQFLFDKGSFKTVLDNDEKESKAAYEDLLHSNPPILIEDQKDHVATLSRYFDKETVLNFLFAGKHPPKDAPNKRHRVGAVLLGFKEKIDVAEFSFLSSLHGASFVTHQPSPRRRFRS